MASPATGRKLPYLPPEIWGKIFAEVSRYHTYKGFVQLWTQYRHMSSVFRSAIEMALIDEHLRKATIQIDLFAVLSNIFLVKSGKMSEAMMIGPDSSRVFDRVRSSVLWLPLTFQQLSSNNNNYMSFRYQGLSTDSDEWPKVEHLSGKVMLHPFRMSVHNTVQHLPVQIEWVNRNEHVTLTFTFNWRQLFSMFIARDVQTFRDYFVYRRLRFAGPCTWSSAGDRTAMRCALH